MEKIELVNEIHRNARKNFVRRKTLQIGVKDTLQIDLIDMSSHAKVNRNHHWILVAIDIFSKLAFAQPVKTKKGHDVTKAMEHILKQYAVKNIHSDMGTEFYNSHFKSLMQKYKINHYSTFSVKKAAMAERFIRTLKTLLWKQFSIQGSYKWLGILKNIVTNYNNTKHSTIKMKPNEVNKDNEIHLLTTVYKSPRSVPVERKQLKVGDYVRISKYKSVFEKGYTPNFSTEIFKIIKVQHTHPITYILEDLNGIVVKGGFYKFELLKTNFPDTYLVEKVLKKQGDRLYVKWLGFAQKTWINKNDLLN